jgi:hypothetical protein
MMCQCKFTDYNKCTTLVQDFDSVKGCVCGDRQLQELFIPSTQFFWEPKTTLKNKVYLIKITKDNLQNIL